MNQDPAAKLTSTLLARKGKARPADLLDGDSGLISHQDRPALTLVRNGNGTPPELFDPDEIAGPDEHGRYAAGSLLAFTLTRPDTEPSETGPRDLAAMVAASDLVEAPDLQQEQVPPEEPRVGELEHDVEDAASAEPPALVSYTEAGAARAFAGGGPHHVDEETEQTLDLIEDSSGLRVPWHFRMELRQVLIWTVALILSFLAGLWLLLSVNVTPLEDVPGQSAAVVPDDAVSSNAQQQGTVPRQSNLNGVPEAEPAALAPAAEDPVTSQPTPEKLAAAKNDTKPLAVHETPSDGSTLALPSALQVDPAATPVEAEDALGLGSEPGGSEALSLASQDALPATPTATTNHQQSALAPLPRRNPNREEAPRLAAPAAPGDAYVVQLFAGRDAAQADAEMQRLEASFPDLSRAGGLVVQAVEADGYGIFYRIRSSKAESSEDARLLCQGLKAEGQDCLVVRDQQSES